MNTAPNADIRVHKQHEALRPPVKMNAYNMWSNIRLSHSANHLLAALPVADLELLRPHLVRVRLVTGQLLLEPGQTAEHVFFFEEGMVSLNSETQNSVPGVQVAMIGREGMAGSLALLDPGTTAFTNVVVQTAGLALRIRVVELLQCMDESLVLRKICLGYIKSLMHQVMSNAASNAQGTLTERCIRWLLMAQERSNHDQILVTHEALAVMLGVRRSGITVTTAALQKAGLILTSRGRITILDRPGLRRLAERALNDIPAGPLRNTDDAAVAATAAGNLGDPSS